jgi:hypothetical protein
MESRLAEQKQSYNYKHGNSFFLSEGNSFFKNQHGSSVAYWAEEACEIFRAQNLSYGHTKQHPAFRWPINPLSTSWPKQAERSSIGISARLAAGEFFLFFNLFNLIY